MGIGDGWSVALTVPVVRMHYQILRHQTVDGDPLPYYEEEHTGFGDSALMLQSAQGVNGNVRYWFGMGISVPTAKERDYPALSGADFGEVLTLGSGTWDPILMHGFSFQTGGIEWLGSVWSRLTLYENQFGYRSGSVIQSYFGLGGDVAETSVSGRLLLGYRHQWRARRDGLDVLNSGGDWVSVMPQVTWRFSPQVSFQIGVDIPLWRDIYAAPGEIEQAVNGQTDANVRWSFGLTFQHDP